MQGSLAYYQALGFALVNCVPPDSETPVWAMLQCGEVVMMLQTFESLGKDLPEVRREGGGSLLFYVQVKGIRAFFERISKQVQVLKGLEKTFYGATEFSIADCNDYVWTFAEDEA